MAVSITNPLIFLGLLSTLSAFIFSFLALWRLGRRGWVYSLLTLAAGLWSLFYVLQLASPELATKVFWLKTRNSFSQVVVLAWVAFSMKYTGRNELLKPIYFGFLALPSLMIATLIMTNYGGLFIRTASIASGSVPLLSIVYGVGFWLNVVYGYFLFGAGFWFLASRFVSSYGLYRKQILAFVVAALFPAVSSVLYVLEQTPYVSGVNPLPNVELMPYSFVFTVVVLGLALFNYRLFDLVPIARSEVVENLEDGVIVLDSQDTIVDVNTAACDLVGVEEHELIGSSIGNVLSQYSEVVQHYRGVVDRVNDEIVIHDGDRKKHIDLNISPVSGERQSGRVVLLRDITKRKSNEEELRKKNRELERQNEQLEDFAAVVAHDLRNPINVLEAYLPVAREENDPDAFEAIGESVDRMKEIIDDVLMLARQGQTVTRASEVAIDAAAHEAWGNVESGDAELVVKTGREVIADRNRLLHVFENLFRNSVEHAGNDAKIELGPLENGFYVEDDGPGIPPDEREEVLDHGYTTSDGGTGFGLSIVRSIVEAHGWGIRVTQGSMGGARFEVTGVQESPVELD